MAHHPLALVAQRRASRVGLTPLVVIPDLPTFDLGPVLTQADNLASQVQQLRDAQTESSNLQIPGFSTQEAQDLFLTTVASGQLDPKAFLKTFFSTGAAVACTAAGAGALAPLCAQGGKVIGEVIGGLQAKGAGVTGTAASDALGQMMQADAAMLKKIRDSIFYGLAARFNSAPEAMAEATAVLDEFYPQKVITCPWSEHVDYKCPPDKLKPFLTGFYIPFYTTNACALLGVAYSFACTHEYWEWQMDYSSPVVGKTNEPLTPFWVQNLFQFIQNHLAKSGVDVSGSFAAIWKDHAEKEAKGGSRWQAFEHATALRLIYQDIRDVVWPALEIALRKRLEAVVVKAAVKANEKLLESIANLTSTLAQRVGCSSGACFQKIRADVVQATRNLETMPVSTIVQKLEETFPEQAPIKVEKPSALRPVIAFGVAGALVYALHRFIKRYVLCPVIPSPASLATPAAT